MGMIKQRWVLILLAILWLSGIAVGMTILFKHENTGGIAAVPPANWPVDSKIVRRQDLPTLIMFGHPHCPCTRASIGELALLMAKSQQRLDAQVYFVKPKGVPDNWQQTDLWQSAAMIPGVTVKVDIDGEEANRFRAQTSGQTLLYSKEGKLLFQGGITMSRGHSGDNIGRSTIFSLINGNSVEQNTTTVFGCALCRPNQIEKSEGR